MAGRADIVAGAAHIRLWVKKNEFTAGLQSAGKALKAWTGGVGKIAAIVSGFGASIIGSLAAAANSFAKSGDEINKMSERTGASVEALSELRYAAGQSGASLEDLETAFRAIAKKGGTGDPAEKLEALADELAAIKDPGMRAKKAMDEMGKSGTKMLPLMLNGAKGIRELRKEAQELGLTITKEQADKATAFGDAWDRVKASVGATVFAIGAAVAPTFINLFEIIKQGAVIVGNWVRANEGVLHILEDITLVAASGNWVAVGNLIVASLNVAWLEAVGFFEDIWTGAKWAFLTIWQNATTDLAKMFIKTWAGIESGWATMIFGLESRWDAFRVVLLNGIQEIQKRIGNFIIDAAEKAGAVTPEFAKAWRQSLNEPIESGQAERIKESIARQADIGRRREEALSGIDRNAAGAGGILDADKRRAMEQLTANRNKQILAGQVGRDAARMELNKSMEAVRKAAEARRAADVKREMGLGLPGLSTPTSGTFSAAAALALGQGGGTQERIARTAEETRKLIAEQKEHIKEMRAQARLIAQGLRHN